MKYGIPINHSTKHWKSSQYRVNSTFIYTNIISLYWAFSTVPHVTCWRNIKHFPYWYCYINIDTSRNWRTRRAQCFHTISSFSNFYEQVEYGYGKLSFSSFLLQYSTETQLIQLSLSFQKCRVRAMIAQGMMDFLRPDTKRITFDSFVARKFALHACFKEIIPSIEVKISAITRA